MTRRTVLTSMAVALTLAPALLSRVVSAGQDAAPPFTPVPILSAAEPDPTFLIECRNASPQPISNAQIVQTLAVELDSITHEMTGGMTATGGSEEPPLQPSAGRMIVVSLSAGGGTTGRVYAGARTRVSRVIPISSGQHTVRFRCAGTWTDRIVFHWDLRP